MPPDKENKTQDVDTCFMQQKKEKTAAATTTLIFYINQHANMNSCSVKFSSSFKLYYVD